MAGTSPFRGGFAWRFAKRLPPQRELSVARLTEDKLFCLGVHCCGGRVYLPPFAAKVSVSCPSDTRRWTEPVWQLSARPRHPFGHPLISLYRIKRWRVTAALSAAVTTNSKIGKRAHAAWARTFEGRVKPIPSHSSGEGGWGRGASLREAASPPASPLRNLFGREREGGDFSVRKGPSLASFHLPLLVPVLDGVLG